MSDTRVFIGGSRHLSRLNAETRQRLDKIIGGGFAVLIGDANGADKAVQTYLAKRQYPAVTVFCMMGKCRNNVGGWSTRQIQASRAAHGFALYAQKDAAMAAEASHGFMLWDGESKGTLNNVVSLVKIGKPVVVFFGPAKAFVNVRSREDVIDLLSRCERSDVQRFERELDLERTLHPVASLL